jgi:GNAT superfamily N-acetyltransferase
MTEDEVARLEAVEMAAWEDIFAAAPAPLAQQLGLATRRYGPALATVAKAIDNGQFCRIQGCGLPGDEPGASVDQAIALFRGLGLKNYLIQIPPGPEADHLMMRAREAGLVPFRRTWTKFRRGRETAPEAATKLSIVEATAANAKDFGDVAVAGFGMPPFLSAWLSALPGRDGWRCYVAYDGEDAVGVGAAFLHAGAAWLGIGATRPEARGQGSQSAILARRVQDAIEAGCELLLTETGSAVPGEPQTSFQNILRAGFEIAYERVNFTEPA